MPQPQFSPDETRDLIFGICDRLCDHGHCTTDVVLAPSADDGEPDWERTSPANVEALPADEWPDDEQAARRACVIVSNVDGCDPETTLIVRLDPSPHVQHVHGPEADRIVAEQIILRDIEAEPSIPPKTDLMKSLDALADKFERETEERHATFDRLVPYAEAYGGEIRGSTLFGAKVDGALGQIAFAASGRAWLYTDRGSKPVDLPEKKAGDIKIIDPADWHGRAIPDRNWYIDGIVPGRQVTILSGDGGTGKSLLAYQIGVAGALGIETVGLAPAKGRVVYLAAEDDEDELIRRGDDILRNTGHSFANLKGQMRIIPMAGRNAELMFINPNREMQTSDMAAKIEELVRAFRPELLILDTSADLFGGDENNRVHVRFFVTMLRRLAMDHKVAVLLLSHPSVAGMISGSGTSGSTAWNNSVRSRLYLTADNDDEDVRVLKGMKANYGRKGGEIRMRWREGAFVLDDGKPSAATGLLNKRADEKFRELLSAINRTGQRVAPTKGINYAPAVMATRPDAEGMTKKALEGAMQRLLAAGLVRVVMDGPPSRQRQRLVVSAEDFGPEAEAA
ncbi:AAA family ATPase [Mesorhizobium sp. PUT5]|uniref:AAA family ATPase n=1 Tax=Mesorhizobium sp. PUT5 TaxID=3454629 RepID=UPI003FA4266D